MHLLVLHQLGHQRLQSRHPSLEEVTVLEEDPVTVNLAFFDVLGGVGALARSQTHDLESVVFALSGSVVSDRLHRVDTLAEHEDDRIIGL